MSKWTPVKNSLIPAIVQVKIVWFVNNSCNFMKFAEWCFILWVKLPYHMAVMYLWMLDLKFKSEVRV